MKRHLQIVGTTVLSAFILSCSYRFTEAAAERDILRLVLDNLIEEYESSQSDTSTPVLIFLTYSDTCIANAALERYKGKKSLKFLPGDSASYFRNMLLPLPVYEGQVWSIRIDWNSHRADIYSRIAPLNVRPRIICGNDAELKRQFRSYTLYRTFWGGWKRENPSRTNSKYRVR